MTERTRYGFEEALNLSNLLPSQAISKAGDYYNRFLKNLNLDNQKIDSNTKALLKRYVANVHVNSSWYNSKLRTEKALQAIYFVISIALLILVPYFVYIAPEFFGMSHTQPPSQIQTNASNPIDITTQLTVLLTGFFAAYRGVTAWLKQRKLIGPYWKARSDLLDQIYTLETKWGPKEAIDKIEGMALTKEFEKAIRDSLNTARSAIQAERKQFYTSYTFPEIDLTESLSSAGTNANSIIKMFESDSAKKTRSLIKEREIHAASYNNLKAEVAGLIEIINEWNEDLDIKKTELSKTSDPQAKTELNSEISAMISELAKLKTERRLKIKQQAQKRVRAGLD